MGTMIFYQMPEQGLTFGKMKDGAGVAENQLLHRLFDTPSPWDTDFCKSLIIRNNVPRTCVQRVSETFAGKFAIFYAQTIEKFVVAIPDLIESNRTAEKVSGKQNH